MTDSIFTTPQHKGGEAVWHYLKCVELPPGELTTYRMGVWWGDQLGERLAMVPHRDHRQHPQGHRGEGCGWWWHGEWNVLLGERLTDGYRKDSHRQLPQSPTTPFSPNGLRTK